MQRKRRAGARIAVVVADRRWRAEKEWLSLIRRAARLGLAAPRQSNVPEIAHSPIDTGPALTILLANDAELQAMNRRFRKKNKPTNVLSFPARDAPYLGDIALSFETIANEARAQKKPFAHHAAHMALHGVLHLLGYDHMKAREAALMESTETALLGKLAIAPPYEPRPLPGKAKAA